MKIASIVMVIAAAVVASPLSLSAQQPAPDKQRAEGVHEGLAYASAIQVGNTVYVSGVVSRGETLEAQLIGIYEGLARVLAPFGATLQDVVKETVFTTDMDALRAANGARKQAYGAHAPAATWVQIERLLMPTAQLEIEVIAVPGSRK